MTSPARLAALFPLLSLLPVAHAAQAPDDYQARLEEPRRTVSYQGQGQEHHEALPTTAPEPQQAAAVDRLSTPLEEDQHRPSLPLHIPIYNEEELTLAFLDYNCRHRTPPTHAPRCPVGVSISATLCFCGAAWFTVATSLGIPSTFEEVLPPVDLRAIEKYFGGTAERQYKEITDLRDLLRLGKKVPLSFFYPPETRFSYFSSDYDTFSTPHKRYLNSILLGLQYAPSPYYEQVMATDKKYTTTIYEEIFKGIVQYDEAAAHEIVKPDNRLLVHGFVRLIAPPEAMQDVVGVIQKHLNRPYSQVMGDMRAYLREKEERRKLSMHHFFTVNGKEIAILCSDDHARKIHIDQGRKSPRC